MATQAQIRFEPLQIRTDGTSWLRWIETVTVHHAGPNGSQPLTVATLESASVFTPSDEDANAYAQLFASAPDLYAALEATLELFDRDGFQEMRGEAWHDTDTERIRNALARARGRA